MFVKWMRRRGEFKIFLRDSRDGKILLRSSLNVLWKWGVGVWMHRVCVEFVISGWFKVKFYDFINWSWNKQWEILFVVISKSCFWWFDWYWRGLKLRKVVTKDWVHVSPGPVVRERAVVEITCTFTEIIVVERFQFRKMGWTSKLEILCK